MRHITGFILITALLTAVCLPCSAKKKDKKDKELPPVVHREYKVEGGKIQDITPTGLKDSTSKTLILPADSIPRDSIITLDTARVELSKRDQRRMEYELEDSTRYSYFFRDTMPLSRMSAISMVVPGFSQLHNKQYWKIPVAWASLAGMIVGFRHENLPYKSYKTQYDYMVSHQATREELDPVQSQMIRYNTRRQLFMFGIYASWVYFICDGAVNYPGKTSSVKKATTLSTILPGAGQFYNGSYWKVPFVLGGFATMAYVIDWNNRGYQRFKTAYNLATDGDASTVDEFNGRYTPEFLRNLRSNYRRNRDLCIIMTGGMYLLNIIDAHVDAQLKDYDISDDLSMTIEPTMMNFYSTRSTLVNLPGMCLAIRF